MQVPADRLLREINVRLTAMFGNAAYGSDEEALLAAVRMLERSAQVGMDLVRSALAELDSVLADHSERLALRASVPTLWSRIQEVLELVNSCRSLASGNELDRHVDEVVATIAKIAADIGVMTQLPEGARTRAAVEIACWDARRIAAGLGTAPPIRADTAVTAERLSRYLGDRFNDASISITGIRPLPGGFGKETILFEVGGRLLSGDFVMRRDRLTPFVDNDCHRVAKEYPVLDMAFSRGFPAPEALWLDTEHPLLPGGDFIIMRRAPGSVGGDSFGGSERCSDELVRVLATALANLHNLRPLVELGDLTESIRVKLWSQPIGAVTRRYIQAMYNVYLRDVKTPLPALCALYGWLLSHVPEAEGPPVLLHGDVGFHNMVLDNGRLSALVDWEFSHIGDPAEDVGYVQSVVGASMDFDQFMLLYREAGGRYIDKERLRFFHVWGKVRNATAASFSTNAFAVGRLNDLKLAYACPGHLPRYITDACRILESN